MTANEYIDHITRDIQELINALDDDPNTSAKVKGRIKGIQNRINTFYDIYDKNDIDEITPCMECKNWKRQDNSKYGVCSILGRMMKETEFCCYGKGR